MSDPLPPRHGSLRAAILAVLPVDGSPMSRRDLLRALPLHRHTAATAALRREAGGDVVREDRPGGQVFYSRAPVWIGRQVRTTRRATCVRCGGVIREAVVRCPDHS